MLNKWLKPRDKNKHLKPRRTLGTNLNLKPTPSTRKSNLKRRVTPIKVFFKRDIWAGKPVKSFNFLFFKIKKYKFKKDPFITKKRSESIFFINPNGLKTQKTIIFPVLFLYFNNKCLGIDTTDLIIMRQV
jgi:hypothetical protein